MPKGNKGWGHRSVIDHLLIIQGALGSVLVPYQEGRNGRGRENDTQKLDRCWHQVLQSSKHFHCKFFLPQVPRQLLPEHWMQIRRGTGINPIFCSFEVVSATSSHPLTLSAPQLHSTEEGSAGLWLWGGCNARQTETKLGRGSVQRQG